jgi:hypothetical protein
MLGVCQVQARRMPGSGEDDCLRIHCRAAPHATPHGSMPELHAPQPWTAGQHLQQSTAPAAPRGAGGFSRAASAPTDKPIRARPRACHAAPDSAKGPSWPVELCGGATYLIAELTRVKDAVLVDVDHLRTKPVRRLTVQHIRVQPKQPRLDRGERRAFPAAMVTLLADWRETADRPERGATYAAEAAARKVRLSIAARESRSPDMAEVRWIQVGSATKRNLVGDQRKPS